FSSRGVQPECKTAPRLVSVCRIRFDKRVFIVGNAPITRIEDDPSLQRQLRWDWARSDPRGKFYRRGVPFEFDSLLRNAAFQESLRLISAQYFELIDASPPEARQTKEQTKR